MMSLFVIWLINLDFRIISCFQISTPIKLNLFI